MAGFQRAISLGLDGIELDVLLTKDEKLVVFHDLDTERLTGVSKTITEMTWPEIQQLEIKQSLNVGDHIINYGKPEKIVLLEDVLEETRGKLLIDIEIKAYNLDFELRHTGAAVANLVKKMGVEKDVFITSFNFWPLWWLERVYPGLESGFSYSPAFRTNFFVQNLMESSLMCKIVGSTSTNMSLNMFDHDTVERFHEMGLAVGAWTVFSLDSKWLGDAILPEKELEIIRDLTRRGIDYFITDDPVQLRDFLKTL